MQITEGVLVLPPLKNSLFSIIVYSSSPVRHFRSVRNVYSLLTLFFIYLFLMQLLPQANSTRCSFEFVAPYINIITTFSLQKQVRALWGRENQCIFHSTHFHAYCLCVLWMHNVPFNTLDDNNNFYNFVHNLPF